MRRTSFAFLLTTIALLVGCGKEETSDPANSQAGSSPRTGSFDRAYIAALTAHHENSLKIVAVARREASDEWTQRLAEAIFVTQSDELSRIAEIDERLAASGEPIGDLGMARSKLGMDHEPSDLSPKGNFDRQFMRIMIASHQGAIEMSKKVVERGQDAELQSLARTIIGAQTAEVAEMIRRINSD